MSLLDRVRALLGRDAVLEDTGAPDGVPRVAPASPDAVALLLGTAREEGWRVRLEGAGTWMPADAPADLALTTRRLDRIPSIQPQDLAATAEAGIGCDQLRQQLADHGVWLALDPPGLAGRTLGSVVATATAGPLRHGLGAVRDHLVGVTFVTGDGRLIQSGGRVMKNVAGSAALVAAEEAGLRTATGGRFAALRADEAHAFWMRAAEVFATRPVTFRLGGLPDSSDDLLDLVQHQVGDEWVSASPSVGTLRWGGETTVERLRHLRRTLAAQEVPLTVERAPWPLRRAVGHFGAYREGVGPLVAGLRQTFDPASAIAVAVESDDRVG